MGILQKPIEEYIDTFSPLIPGELSALQQEAYANNFPIIPKQTALFLASLIAALKPKDILEIGCCIGFSAGLMSLFTSNDGHITTIERYGLMIEKARKNFDKYNLNDKITLLEGDALTILKELKGKYDFIFLDAAKGQYLQFLPYCLKILKVGGVLLADDIFLNSYTAMSRKAVPRRHRTTHKRMNEFVYTLTHTEGVQTSLITVGEGLIMCTKTTENIILTHN